MGGDFRAIPKAEPVAAEPQPDPRLALVEQFATTQAPPADEVPTEDAQEPAEQTQPDTGDSGADEGQEDAGASPADAEQGEEPAAPESEPEQQEEQAEDEPEQEPGKPDDYDPIAAVLG